MADDSALLGSSWFSTRKAWIFGLTFLASSISSGSFMLAQRSTGDGSTGISATSQARNACNEAWLSSEGGQSSTMC